MSLERSWHREALASTIKRWSRTKKLYGNDGCGKEGEVAVSVGGLYRPVSGAVESVRQGRYQMAWTDKVW